MEKRHRHELIADIVELKKQKYNDEQLMKEVLDVMIEAESYIHHQTIAAADIRLYIALLRARIGVLK